VFDPSSSVSDPSLGFIMHLSALGWNAAHAQAFLPHSVQQLQPARIVQAHRQAYVLHLGPATVPGICTGRLLHDTVTRADLPVVGDWVAARLRPGEPRADIHAVLPRRTRLSRRASGPTDEEQVLAANLDTVLLLIALDQNYNLRRIERFLTFAHEGGVRPVVVLNKSDLHPDPAAAVAETAAIAGGAPVVTLSATQGSGLDQLDPWLNPAATLALLGSSGVGKSTLINRLLGADRQATATLSEAVGKGRHTTTHRELFVTPGGALVIDTPGLRELQFWDPPAAAVAETFADITALAASCRFHDCRHDGEPGCAVQAALADGTLDAARWASFNKLRREQAYAASREDPRLARAHREAWKKIHRSVRARMEFEANADE